MQAQSQEQEGSHLLKLLTVCSVLQHVLLARQLNQPAQHLPLKGLTQQQQSQVLNQYNHDQQRATAPTQNMVGYTLAMCTLQVLLEHKRGWVPEAFGWLCAL